MFRFQLQKTIEIASIKKSEIFIFMIWKDKKNSNLNYFDHFKCFNKSLIFMHFLISYYEIILAVTQRCSIKMVFLEISQNLQENTCARVSFLIKFVFYRPKRIGGVWFEGKFFNFLIFETFRNLRMEFTINLNKSHWSVINTFEVKILFC